MLRSSDLCGGSKRLIGQDKTSRVNNLALNLKEFGMIILSCKYECPLPMEQGVVFQSDSHSLDKKDGGSC